MVEPHVTELLSGLRARADMSLEALAREAGYRGASSIQRYFDGTFKKRFLPLDVAQKFASVLAGLGDPPTTEAEVIRLAGVARAVDGLKPIRKPPAKYTAAEVVELDVRASGGFGAMPDSEHEREIGRWSLPEPYLKAQTTAPVASLRIITIYGDSQIPDYQPGDRVMVDTSDRTPSPPGTFVIWDGMAVVVKRVEHIPKSDPPRLRLISSNPLYQNYELDAHDVEIQGRVIGKWLWR